MTLLELRNKIDKAIAQCGGDTKVEGRNAAGDREYIEAVMMIPVLNTAHKSIVVDTDDDIAQEYEGSIVF